MDIVKHMPEEVKQGSVIGQIEWVLENPIQLNENKEERYIILDVYGSGEWDTKPEKVLVDCSVSDRCIDSANDLMDAHSAIQDVGFSASAVVLFLTSAEITVQHLKDIIEGLETGQLSEVQAMYRFQSNMRNINGRIHLADEDPSEFGESIWRDEVMRVSRRSNAAMTTFHSAYTEDTLWCTIPKSRKQHQQAA